MTRAQAIAHIAAEVAAKGKTTALAIRLYTESRMSMASFREAINRGMKQYKATNMICGSALVEPIAD